MKKILLFSMMALFVVELHAQRTDRSFIRRGNSLFQDSLFIKAEENYLKAIDMNPELYEGNYNLGNAYTAQQKPNEAVEQYRRTANTLEEQKRDLMVNPEANAKELELCKTNLAKTYHNEGLVYHMSDQYDKAIESYKEALKNNPLDDETRYNLIVAQRMLKQQQEQQQNQEQQNQEQQEQQEQDQQQQNQEQQQQNQEQQQEQEQNQEQQQEQDMSQENAEQILEAVMQDEKDVQERVQEQLIKVQNQKPLEKDW